jgi:hypothetical protein
MSMAPYEPPAGRPDVLAIVGSTSFTTPGAYGSGWTADQAEKQGKTVWRVIL